MLIVITALSACAWFVLGARQAHDLAQATSIVTGGAPSRAEAAHAASLLDAAGTLDPDLAVKLVRVQLLHQEGYTPRAIALAEQVTSAEPANSLAWRELAGVAGANNQVTVVALQHVHELLPPVPHSR